MKSSSPLTFNLISYVLFIYTVSYYLFRVKFANSSTVYIRADVNDQKGVGGLPGLGSALTFSQRCTTISTATSPGWVDWVIPRPFSP